MVDNNKKFMQFSCSQNRIKYKEFKQSNSRGSESAVSYSVAPTSHARGYDTCSKNVMVTPSISYNVRL